jgi:hypothetical protein
MLLLPLPRPRALPAQGGPCLAPITTALARLLLLRLIIVTPVLMLSRFDLLHDLHCLSRELALLSNLWAILVEQERERNAHQREKRRNGRGPVDTKVLIHVAREQRERGTEERPQNRVGSQHRRGVDRVRVYQVVHDGNEDEQHAEAKGRGADDAYDPMDRRVVCPREPEHTDGKADATDKRGREACLGGRRVFPFRLVGVLDFPVARVVPKNVEDGNNKAYSNTKECEAANTLGPPARLLEDDGEGGEEHVKGTVDDGHVDREQEDDGLPQEQDPGAGDGDLEGFRWGLLVCIGPALQATTVDSARALREVLGSLLKKHGSVGFWDEKGADDPNDAGEDRFHTLNPPPPNRLPNESTNNRSDDRSLWLVLACSHIQYADDTTYHKGRRAEHRHCNTTLLGGKHICDDTTSVC